jgi:hypothetical protein
MRHVALGLLLIAAGAASTAQAKALLSPDSWLCAIGQFTSADGKTTVEIDNGAIAVGACPMTPAKVKTGKKRSVLSARWPGCDGFKGAVRVTAKLTTGTCDAVDVRVKAKRLSRRFAAARTKGEAKDCQTGDTFDQIQRRIFGAKGCRVETCHGSAKQGGLDLRVGTAYQSLVSAAVGAPGDQRVQPGSAAKSFLVRKLAGVLAVGEGDRMPSVGHPLRPLELDLVRAWIDAGAPETGAVDGAPCPAPHKFQEAAPLTAPANGYQIYYEGPILQPGEELEGCEWIEAPNGQDFVVGTWEYSINPGTHHFALWEHRPEARMPALHTWKKDTACIQGGARFGISLSGSPEAPYYVEQSPGNTAKVLKGGSILGINPHYFNEFDVPIQIKLWINLHPAPANAIIADTLTSLDASLDGKSPYNIFVPPFEVKTLRLRWANHTAKPMTIPQLSSHMHQRGVRFDVWNSSGTPIYENTDWAHPRILNPDPPIVLQPGDYLEYQCTHDNGVTRAVRKCGDSYLDKNCTPGDPMPVVFNVTAQDEMCLLTGLLY